MTRPGFEPAPPASEAKALTITLSGPYIQRIRHRNQYKGNVFYL